MHASTALLDCEGQVEAVKCMCVWGGGGAANVPLCWLENTKLPGIVLCRASGPTYRMDCTTPCFRLER